MGKNCAAMKTTVIKRSTIINRSTIIKRSIDLSGHKTSVSLENEFWDALREIADEQKSTMSAIIQNIDNMRQQANLSSSIRLYVLEHFRKRATPARAAAGGGSAQLPLTWAGASVA
jgi:predicted DNA-binding ribbon-helix-helix protein